MSEHNRAIRMAQKLLRHRADAFPTVELHYNQWEQDPAARNYRQAAVELDALIIEEES